MKLPKVTNVQNPGALATVGAEFAGREYEAKLSGLSTESSTKLSSIVSGSKAERDAFISEQKLKAAQSETETRIAESEARTKTSMARSFQAQTALDQKQLQLTGAEDQLDVSLAGAEVERIKTEAYYGEREMASEARTDAATFNVLKAGVNVGLAAYGVFQKYDADKNKQQQDTYKLQLMEVDVNWEKAHANIESYDFADIPEDVTAKLGLVDDGQKVPAYVVNADWKRSVLNGSIDELSMGISNEDYRSESVNVARGWEAGIYAGGVQDGIKGQPIYNLTMTMRKSAEYLKAGNYGMAIETIENSSIDEDLKIEEIDKIKSLEQNRGLTTIEGLDAFEDPTAELQIQYAYDKVVARNEQMVGNLSEAQYRMHRSNLKSKLTEIEVQKANTAKSVSNNNMFTGKQMADAAGKGQIPNVEAYGQIRDALDNSPLQSHKNQAVRMDIAMAVGVGINDFKGLNAKQMMATNVGLVEFRTEQAAEHGPIVSEIFDTLIQKQQEMMDDFNTDSVKYARENNLMPVKNFNPNDVVGSVTNAIQIENWVTNQGGKPGQFMEDVQYTAVNAHLQTLDSQGLAMFAGEVMVAAKGDRVLAGAFVEPMKKLGLNLSFAMGAQLSYRGNLAGSTAVFKGGGMRIDNPALDDAVLPAMNTHMAETVNDAFAYNRDEQASVSNAIVDVYVSMGNGAVDPTGEPNMERLNKATQLVLGEMVTYDGVTFSAPNSALNTPKKIEDFLGNQVDSYYVGMDPRFQKGISNRVDDGQIQMVPSGPYTFNMKIKATGDLVPDDSGAVRPNGSRGPGRAYEFSFRNPTTTKSGIALEGREKILFDQEQAAIAKKEAYLKSSGRTGEVDREYNQFIKDKAKSIWGTVMDSAKHLIDKSPAEQQKFTRFNEEEIP